MKKKGFTLVELLAVIAILAILVIIALPNVLKMFNDAKEKAFTTEVREIYKTAQQQWIADSMFSTGEKEYVRCSTCTGKELDMSGRRELEYYIKLDKSGNVITYKATDGSYQYSYTGTGLKIENIKNVVQISKIEDESDIISISNNGATGAEEYVNTYEYLYYVGETEVNLGNLPRNITTYTSYQDAINASNHNFFIRFKMNGNTIEKFYMGFLYNNEVYYLEGGNPEVGSSNLTFIKSMLGRPGMPCEPVEYAGSGEMCFKNGIGYSAYDAGEIIIKEGYYECRIYTGANSLVTSKCGVMN